MPINANGGWNPVEEAVRMIGGPGRAVHACFVTWHTVRYWRKHGEVTGSREAVLLSEATGGRITIRQLAGMDDEHGKPKGREDVPGIDPVLENPPPDDDQHAVA